MPGEDNHDESFIELGDEDHEPAQETASDVEARGKGRGKSSAGAVAQPASDDAADVEEERLHPILTNDEVLAARAKARAALDKERRAVAMKAVEDAEKQRLRNEEGMVTGDGPRDEMVDVTLDLAEHSQNVTINGQAYWHGHTYTVPRHVADTLREVQARGWTHQSEADGKDKAQQFAARRQFSMLAKGKAVQTPTSVVVGRGGVKNAPKSFAAEELRA